MVVLWLYRGNSVPIPDTFRRIRRSIPHHMTAIMLESALFIALLAVVGALIVTALGITPLGRRIRQTANRKRIDRQADLTCPVHGLQREKDLVRLPTGEPLCPHCYREAVHGHIN